MNIAIACVILAAAVGCVCAAPEAHTVENRAYRLSVGVTDRGVHATLDDKRSGLRLADGIMVYRTDAAGHEHPGDLSQITDATVAADGDTLTIRGKLSGLDLEHTFSLPENRPVMEEFIRLTNRTASRIALSDFECGFTRMVAGVDGSVIDELREDRWVAVPLRARATDPPGYYNDFSVAELVDTPGSEPHPRSFQDPGIRPSRHRWSEGWAWTHGDHTLGVFKFCQENMLFSVVSTIATPEGRLLRFGGACAIMGEPAILTRLDPGQTADLGLTRYETFASDYMGAMYGFRRLLDEKGCRFPADYDPLIHWEQLYDMEGAWDERATRFTKAIVEGEAQKGVEYSCEAIYLDPGWDTAFASFIWGDWLGPRKQFIDEMQSKYGLKVALHCPMASWMSCDFPMGPSAVSTYPSSAYTIPPASAMDAAAMVPASRAGRRNVALASGATVAASSVIAGYDIHQISHLIDGWYGNSQSWIPASLPAWAEIDLGTEYTISSVRVGNDHLQEYIDRAATKMQVLVSTAGSDWTKVAEYAGLGIGVEHTFAFPAVAADKVRIVIVEGADGASIPRLDEIEIYEDEPCPESELAAFTQSVKRGPQAAAGRPLMCQGSKQYLVVAEKRLLDLCADGVAFLMFDGTWWNGGCVNPAHGHPIPYTFEDHVRAHLDLAQRVHAKYPKTMIEMHDMITGGSSWRLTPIYYKYGLPGSYDENWGFELMWDPMADLKAGRARSLYYYNLGCNIPAYLHIDLRRDNRECVMLWWYASTCRRLGIGGTNADAEVVMAQKQAMNRYRSLESFYKHGGFHGISEAIHVHVLGGEMVVNAFNLSDQPKTISGSIGLTELGLDPEKHYAPDESWARCIDGRLEVNSEMPPWSARVVYVKKAQ